LNGAAALTLLSHPAQIILGVRCHYSREIMGQLERARFVKSEVQSAKQLTLLSQFRDAIRARL
jgi:hypothetical protein